MTTAGKQQLQPQWECTCNADAIFIHVLVHKTMQNIAFIRLTGISSSESVTTEKPTGIYVY